MCSSITHQPAALCKPNKHVRLVGRAESLVRTAPTTRYCESVSLASHHVCIKHQQATKGRAGGRKIFLNFFLRIFFALLLLISSFTRPPRPRLRVSQRVPVAGGQAGRRWSLLFHCPLQLRIGIILDLWKTCAEQAGGQPRERGQCGGAVRCGRAPNQGSRERRQKKEPQATSSRLGNIVKASMRQLFPSRPLPPT